MDDFNLEGDEDSYKFYYEEGVEEVIRALVVSRTGYCLEKKELGKETEGHDPDMLFRSDRSVNQRNSLYMPPGK